MVDGFAVCFPHVQTEENMDMKRLIIILSFFCLKVQAQKDTTKVDTVQFLKEVGNEFPQFQQFIYKNVSAEKYEMVMQMYAAFINTSFEEWKKKQKK